MRNMKNPGVACTAGVSVKTGDAVGGITAQLKAENALEWVQKLNNIRACAREIVEKALPLFFG